jgi:ElaA protein
VTLTLTWHTRRFDELTTAQLYAILQLRSRVFVVEQACHYLDLDGADDRCLHLWAEDEAGAIAAYLRVVPAGVKYDEASIGRVVVSPAARGTGLGRELMRRGIDAVGGGPIRIAAQAYLERFYQELGFESVSAPYDDDGIPHIDMIRR